MNIMNVNVPDDICFTRIVDANCEGDKLVPNYHYRFFTLHAIFESFFVESAQNCLTQVCFYLVLWYVTVVVIKI